MDNMTGKTLLWSHDDVKDNGEINTFDPVSFFYKFQARLGNELLLDQRPLKCRCTGDIHDCGSTYIECQVDDLSFQSNCIVSLRISFNDKVKLSRKKIWDFICDDNECHFQIIQQHVMVTNENISIKFALTGTTITSRDVIIDIDYMNFEHIQ